LCLGKYCLHFVLVRRNDDVMMVMVKMVKITSLMPIFKSI